jgi:pimeloyl-ACP methyl ester carboxylesterase
MLWVVVISFLGYLGFGAYLYSVQRSFIYYPVAERKAAGAQAKYLNSTGERLKLWVLSPGKPRAVIYFGGNAEDVSFNISDFRATLPHHTIYLSNYRGYGGSSGEPNQANLFEDALNVFDWVVGQHQSVSIIGRSLGSGVATYLASQRSVDRLVLVTPFDSIGALAQKYFPLYPTTWLLKDKYKSDQYAPKVQANVLLLAAEYDRVIPPIHAKRLLMVFPEGKAKLVMLPGAGHNNISGYDAYWQMIKQFLISM